MVLIKCSEFETKKHIDFNKQKNINKSVSLLFGDVISALPDIDSIIISYLRHLFHADDGTCKAIVFELVNF